MNYLYMSGIIQSILHNLIHYIKIQSTPLGCYCRSTDVQRRDAYPSSYNSRAQNTTLYCLTGCSALFTFRSK